MRISLGILLLALALMVSSGCSRPASAAQTAVATSTSTSADEAVIRASTGRWIDAYNAGDVARIGALYSEDAVVMAPNAPALVGRAAIKDFLAKDIAGARAAGLKVTDGSGTAGISGDLAWHAGTSSVVDAAGKTVATSKYIEVWQRVNGEWLMVRDIWNDDAPAAPVPQT